MHMVSDTAGVEAGGSELLQTIRLRIPARPEYVALCRLAMTGLAQVRSLEEDTVADLKLALTEAVSNSVRHAYAADGGHVDILYELGRDRVGVEVVDDGRRQALVDRHVSVPPGVEEARAEVGAWELMVDEPQRRVGGDGVEAPVGGGLVHDETQSIAGSVDRSAVLARHHPILVGHRARDPRDVVAAAEAA